MGGDAAPGIVIKGADMARIRHPLARFIFVGDQVQIEPHLHKFSELRAVAEILHTVEVIKADTKPSVALRTGRRSSMGLAIDAVREGRAAGVVSAGNTGALMALGMLFLRMIPGIDRPAIASFFPTLRGESVMLDLGANIECSADNLVQFALMGEVFARTVLGLLQPTIGILNVGEEDMKGHDAVRDAAGVLRQTKLPIHFEGFVEGDDITAGTVDVVVTDGFTGNVALKTAEGTARLYSEFLRRAFKSSLFAKLGYLLARHALGKLRARLDPRRYNGAMLLGLNGVVVKSHGGTDALGYANAIGVAIDMAAQGFAEKIRQEIEVFVAERQAPEKAVI
jgi:phosphate acyltransferase